MDLFRYLHVHHLYHSYPRHILDRLEHSRIRVYVYSLIARAPAHVPARMPLIPQPVCAAVVEIVFGLPRDVWPVAFTAAALVLVRARRTPYFYEPQSLSPLTYDALLFDNRNWSLS